MMLLWIEAELSPRCLLYRQTHAAVGSEKVEGLGSRSAQEDHLIEYPFG
jgi:hypothetical protein